MKSEVSRRKAPYINKNNILKENYINAPVTISILNIRGLNGACKQSEILDLVKDRQIDILVKLFSIQVMLNLPLQIIICMEFSG